MSAFSSALAKNKFIDLLTQRDADKALREALRLGAEFAVNKLGQTNGYWQDKLVQIALPKSLAKAQQTLKPWGMSGSLDQLHETMNRAAEQAAPFAKSLFFDAIAKLTLTDAIAIVKGETTAGTQYLQTTTTPALTQAFMPPVTLALENTGAVKALDRAMTGAGVRMFIKEEPKTYLAKHATGAALQGLFTYIGREESSIRADPKKRISNILQSVFG
jgi:hypothetical protein